MAAQNQVTVIEYEKKCKMCVGKDIKLQDVRALTCSSCGQHYHLACLGIVTPEDLERFVCKPCEDSDSNERTKISEGHLSFLNYQPEEDMQNFIADFLDHDFFGPDELPVRRLSGRTGETIDTDYLESHGFTDPIIVKSTEKLDMVVPRNYLTPEALRKKLGDLWQLQVLSVPNQKEGLMYLKEFVTHFNSDKILCSLSLELSRSSLRETIKPPKVVREISFASAFWKIKKPKVYTDRYLQHCKAGSFTNFHLDGGGTSIWHHVCKGVEEMFLIKPTDGDCDELQKYEHWIKAYAAEAKPRSFFEFANPPSRCFRIQIYPGETAFVPGGYIRATFYQEDTVVVGGNFLHAYNMENQMRCYQIEKNCGIESKYRLPNIECIYWQTVVGIHKSYKDVRDKRILRKKANVLEILLKLLEEFPEDAEFPYTSEKFDRNTIVRDAKHFTATHGEANGDQEEDQSLGIDRRARENAADGNSEEGAADDRQDTSSETNQTVKSSSILRK